MRRRGGWVLVVPALLMFLGFALIPLIGVLVLSFTDWNGISATAHWVGLRNFRDLFGSEIARSALWHTLELAAVYVVVVNVIGLGLALALHRTVRSRNLLRAIFFAPVILSPLATAYIWRFIFDYTGPLNGFLHSVGLDSLQRPWLGDPGFALWAVAAVFVWQNAGLSMSFYLAGLQSIPEELDEAAVVDGASTLLRLRAVTLPLLAPAMTISVAFATIQAFRIFDTVIGLTNGGPGSATETLTTQLFNQGFAANRFGYAAAFALVLVVLIATVSIAQISLLRAREARL